MGNFSHNNIKINFDFCLNGICQKQTKLKRFYMIYCLISADTVIDEDPSRTRYLMSGETGVRKAANTVPHDVGDPGV